MKYPTFFVIFFYVTTLGMAFAETEDTLEKAEALITELKFYEAMVALEPLLTNDEKSEAQEEALWLANILCAKLIEVLDDELVEVNRHRNPGFIRYVELEKKTFLNQLGANIAYSEPGGTFVYHYGFLKRLLELYPNSSWHPVAEYYLIGEGRSVAALDHDIALKALYTYVKKHAKSGLAEVYMAYLDIAAINHGIWAVLAHPEDDPTGLGVIDRYTNGDPEKDNERASICKAEALKYYAKFIVNSYRGREVHTYLREAALRGFEDLKQNKNFEDYILVYD